MSISVIHHKGRKILYTDYSSCKTIEETLSILEKVKDYYLTHEGNFYTLNNFTNAPSNNEYMELAKKYAKEVFDARTLKNACCGITGIKKILLSAYNLTVKNKIQAFDTKEEALDYLAKD
ncbi:MAG TPA: hypothetical protein PLK12_04380 [Prolixibacteraceae bacterium]|nr:hypothetical protein [Prolixibacteraceae bacterium]